MYSDSLSTQCSQIDEPDACGAPLITAGLPCYVTEKVIIPQVFPITRITDDDDFIIGCFEWWL